LLAGIKGSNKRIAPQGPKVHALQFSLPDFPNSAFRLPTSKILPSHLPTFCPFSVFVSPELVDGSAAVFDIAVANRSHHLNFRSLVFFPHSAFRLPNSSQLLNFSPSHLLAFPPSHLLTFCPSSAFRLPTSDFIPRFTHPPTALAPVHTPHFGCPVHWWRLRVRQIVYRFSIGRHEWTGTVH